MSAAALAACGLAASSIKDDEVIAGAMAAMNVRRLTSIRLPLLNCTCSLPTPLNHLTPGTPARCNAVATSNSLALVRTCLRQEHNVLVWFPQCTPDCNGSHEHSLALLRRAATMVVNGCRPWSFHRQRAGLTASPSACSQAAAQCPQLQRQTSCAACCAWSGTVAWLSWFPSSSGGDAEKALQGTEKICFPPEKARVLKRP